MAAPAANRGRVLRVDLTSGEIWQERPPARFFQRYLGGAVGAYYLFTETEEGIDPLGPHNILTFTPGYLAHLAVGAYNRVAITAKSPLTGAIIDAQAGGFWGPECKTAGFDAVVVQGQSTKPVYVLIRDGGAEIRDASEMWGLPTGPAEDAIKAEAGDGRLRTSIIGPAGENLVRFANVVNNLRHFAGRGGLGAVMGSKRLKAVAVRMSPQYAPELADRPKTLALLKEINQAYAEDDFYNTILTPHGTPWGLWDNQEKGRLPTRNFAEGVFEGAEEIDHRALAALAMNKKSEGCFACRVRCKRVIGQSIEEGRYEIEARYGGAEYESLGGLGPLLGIDDVEMIEKANELCSQYTLDTISCGATLAWAYDCFERGLLDENDTGGLTLRWGDGETMLRLIEMIATREGFGDLLAEGSMRAARRFGPEAEELAAHNKGLEWPAVDPRADLGQALAYAVNPSGADHMTMAGPDCGPEFWEMASPPEGTPLGADWVRTYFLQQQGGSLIDGFGICRFLVGATGLQRTVAIAEAATGWQTSLWELLRAGARRLALMRAYNAREGFTIAEDGMPARAFMPIENGPLAGTALDETRHRRAVELYYDMCGWDPASGWPTPGKLAELELSWMIDEDANRPMDDVAGESPAERAMGH